MVQPTVFYPPPKLAHGLLHQAFSGILKAIPVLQELAEEKIRKVISLEEKIREIQSLFVSRIERAFSELIGGGREKVEIIVSFLAILELVKQRLVSIRQDGAFSDIMVKRSI